MSDIRLEIIDGILLDLEREVIEQLKEKVDLVAFTKPFCRAGDRLIHHFVPSEEKAR